MLSRTPRSSAAPANLPSARHLPVSHSCVGIGFELGENLVRVFA